MRLLPALILSVAAHAAVLALAAPAPVKEDIRLEVAVRLEAQARGNENGHRASLHGPKATPRAAEPNAAREPAPPAKTAPPPAPKPEQARRAADTAPRRQLPKPARTAAQHPEAPAAAEPETPAPPRDRHQAAPTAQTAPRTAPAPSAQSLVAALAQTLADRNAAAPAPGTAREPMRFGSGQGPKFLERAAIEYPGGALRADRQGQVVVLLELDARGKLLRASVAESAGPRLDKAALRFARASTYAPATRDGRPVPCRALLPITFNLAR